MAFDKLGETDLETLIAQGAEPARALRCAACGATVTSDGARTERGGAHVHRFSNPHGVRFEIGCFTRADGCAPTGGPTEEWTWFTGTAWQVGLCRGCRAHLGWRFASVAPGAGDVFFGLILDRLRYPS